MKLHADIVLGPEEGPGPLRPVPLRILRETVTPEEAAFLFGWRPPRVRYLLRSGQWPQVGEQPRVDALWLLSRLQHDVSPHRRLAARFLLAHVEDLIDLPARRADEPPDELLVHTGLLAQAARQQHRLPTVAVLSGLLLADQSEVRP